MVSLLCINHHDMHFKSFCAKKKKRKKEPRLKTGVIIRSEVRGQIFTSPCIRKQDLCFFFLYKCLKEKKGKWKKWRRCFFFLLCFYWALLWAELWDWSNKKSVLYLNSFCTTHSGNTTNNRTHGTRFFTKVPHTHTNTKRPSTKISQR